MKEELHLIEDKVKENTQTDRPSTVGTRKYKGPKKYTL